MRSDVARHKFPSIVLLAVLLTFATVAAAHAGDRIKSYIQVSSHTDPNIAIYKAKRYVNQYLNPAVFRSVNGHYAVTIGLATRRRAQELVSTMKQSHELPDDAFVTNGERFAEMVWSEAAVALNAAEPLAGLPPDKVVNEAPVSNREVSFDAGIDVARADTSAIYEFQPSLASICNEIGILTAANGGFSTVQSQEDPEFILYEQFCLGRLFAISRSLQLASAKPGAIDARILETCQMFGQVMEPVLVDLGHLGIPEVTARAGELARASGNTRQDLLFTSRICLGVGYKTDNARTALAAAVLMYALGERAYGEIVGHHLLQGLGVTRNFDLSVEWLANSVQPAENGSPPIFAAASGDRTQLIALAVSRLKDMPGGQQN